MACWGNGTDSIISVGRVAEIFSQRDTGRVLTSDIRCLLFLLPQKSSPWKQARVSKDMQRLTQSLECCEVRGTRQGHDTTKILTDRVKKGTGNPPPGS